MPGTFAERHELDELTVTANQQMRRHLEPANLAEERVRIPVQAVREQGLDLRAAEFAGRQADAVHDEQRELCPVRPVVMVRARTLAGRRHGSAFCVDAVAQAHRWLPRR